MSPAEFKVAYAHCTASNRAPDYPIPELDIFLRGTGYITRVVVHNSLIELEDGTLLRFDTPSGRRGYVVLSEVIGLMRSDG